MHIDRKNSAMAHNCQVPVAKLAVVVDIGHTVRYHQKFAVVVHKMDHLTNETAATPNIDGVGSLCPGRTLLPGRKPGRGDSGQRIVAETLQGARSVCWPRCATMPEMAMAFSGQLLDSNLGTRTRLSMTKGNDSRYNLKMSPETQFETKLSRRSCSRSMFAVGADSAIDHLTAGAAELNDDCTTERRQDLGYEPGKSMGAPAFRYCTKRAVNDLLGEPYRTSQISTRVS